MKRLVAWLACLVLAGCLEEPEVVAPDRPPGTGTTPAPRVLVVNSLSETLSSLDLATSEMTVRAALLGRWPSRLESAGNERILAVASGDNAVDVLDARSLAVVHSIDIGIGANPWHAFPYSNRHAIVSGWQAHEVRRIDWVLGRASAPLPTHAGPEGIVVSGTLAFVACTGYVGGDEGYETGRVDVIDLDAWTVVRSIDVGRNPQDLCMDASGRVHVLCTGTYGAGSKPEAGSVHIVDANSFAVEAVVPLGGSPGRFVCTDAGIVWVAGFEGGVRRYDAESGAILPELADATLAAAGFSAVDWDATTDTIWLTHFELDLLLAVDASSGAIDDQWIVGDGPGDVLVFRPEN